MKPIFLTLVLTLALLSCSKKEETKGSAELVGVWKLTEVLSDPGDGSGTFHGVNSQKVIEFHADGTVTSNGDLCVLSIAADASSSGTYSLADYSIHSPGCALSMPVVFQKEGTTLTIYYPCIEGCAARFTKK